MLTPSPDRPHMVTVPVSPYCELARWTLDRQSVAFTEECHPPFLHRLATRRHRGGAVVPVLDLGASSLTDARQVVDHSGGEDRRSKFYETSDNLCLSAVTA